nr:folate family ECF transporter S component [Oscillospiraceae bacterium]
TVLTAHVIGSMIIKSIGFMVSFGYPIESVALRIPLYLGITIVESILLLALLRNKAFSRELERIQQK